MEFSTEEFSFCVGAIASSTFIFFVGGSSFADEFFPCGSLGALSNNFCSLPITFGGPVKV